MRKIIVITGPTGVGKTKLSISLAKKLDGEIINADAMQVYMGLNIGTAKIKEEEKCGIPHHLFDIKDVGDEYSIYNYQIDGRRVIDDILKRDKTPIIVGGTGLYIKALLYDYKLNYSSNKLDLEEFTTNTLYQKLLELNPDTKVDKNNRRRIIRAINYYYDNNKPIEENITDKILYDTIFIGLTTGRENLYNIINSRVDTMIEEGLLKEVKHYYDLGIRSKPLTSGIGYKELYEYFDDLVSLDEAIQNIKKNSRHYAKRQYTFFNNKLPINWFNTNYNDFNKTINEVINFIKMDD